MLTGGEGTFVSLAGNDDVDGAAETGCGYVECMFGTSSSTGIDEWAGVIAGVLRE